MISLELPEFVEKGRQGMHNMARDLFRPIARKYDENEHEYPKELDVLKPPPPKKPLYPVLHSFLDIPFLSKSFLTNIPPLKFNPSYPSPSEVRPVWWGARWAF